MRNKLAGLHPSKWVQPRNRVLFVLGLVGGEGAGQGGAGGEPCPPRCWC